MTTSATPPSLLLRPWPAVVLLAVAIVAGGAALVVDGDAVGTVLGAVTGAATALLLVLLAAQVLTRVLAARERRAEADRAALDGLDPLRAARRDSVVVEAPGADGSRR